MCGSAAVSESVLRGAGKVCSRSVGRSLMMDLWCPLRVWESGQQRVLYVTVSLSLPGECVTEGRLWFWEFWNQWDYICILQKSRFVLQCPRACILTTSSHEDGGHTPILTGIPHLHSLVTSAILGLFIGARCILYIYIYTYTHMYIYNLYIYLYTNYIYYLYI